MTSGGVSLVIKVLLYALAQGQDSSCIEQRDVYGTGFCPFQGILFFFYGTFCASILHLETDPQGWGW